MFIGLHQEDERIHGVVKRRPFIDCTIAVLKKNDDESMQLVDYKPLCRERQVEIEIDLPKG
jgi:hypothetical protein